MPPDKDNSRVFSRLDVFRTGYLRRLAELYGRFDTVLVDMPDLHLTQYLLQTHAAL